MNKNFGKYLWWTLILIAVVIAFAVNGTEESGINLLLAILFFPAFGLLGSLIVYFISRKSHDSDYNSVPNDPSTGSAGIARYIIGGLLLFLGFIFLIGGGCSYGGLSEPRNSKMVIGGLASFVIGMMLIIWNRKQQKKYEEQKYQYEQSQRTPPSWMTNSHTAHSQVVTNVNQAKWQCSKCGTMNSTNIYFCQSCGEYKS